MEQFNLQSGMWIGLQYVYTYPPFQGYTYNSYLGWEWIDGTPVSKSTNIQHYI